MTNQLDDKESEFIRKVLGASADKLFKNLKKDENLSKEDIEKQSIINDHKRGETAKDCLHKIEVFVIWFIFISIISLTMVNLRGDENPFLRIYISTSVPSLPRSFFTASDRDMLIVDSSLI